MNKLIIGIVFLVVGVCVLFFTCSGSKADKEEGQDSIYDFELVKSIELPLDNPGFDLPMSPQYTVIDGIETMIFYIKHKKLVFYDLSKKEKYHEIKLIREVDNYRYINKDSIFVFYFNRNLDVEDENDIYNTDSTQFIRINFDGEIQQYYNFKDKLTRSIENPISIESAICQKLFWNEMFISDNKTYFFLRNHNGYNIGTKEFVENKFPIFCSYDLVNQKMDYSYKLWYPYIKEGIYYPTYSINMYYCLSKNNLPLIRFLYSPKLFEWDYINDTVYEYTLRSSFIDTIPPLDRPTDYDDNNIEAGYKFLSYDPYRKLYFSFLHFSDEKLNGGRSLIIADDNLNYLGEVYNTELFADLIFTKDFIITADKDFDKNVIKVSYYKIVKKTGYFDTYVKNVKDSLNKIRLVKNLELKKYSKRNNKLQLIKYLNKKIEIKEKDYTVVTIYALDGCPGCREYILYVINANKDILEQVPLYLVISGRNKIDVDMEMEAYELDSFKRLHIDTIGIVRKLDYKHGLKNPRLTIVKENKVVLDSIYNAEDIETEFVFRLLESLDLGIDTE